MDDQFRSIVSDDSFVSREERWINSAELEIPGTFRTFKMETEPQ